MFGEFIAEHPKGIIILVVLSILISGYYASQARIGVNTGRFELKNDAYKNYENIIRTFGSEEDNVLVVCISHNSTAIEKNNVISMLELENQIDENVNVTSINSVADYIATGVHLLKLIDKLPRNINIRIDSRVFSDLDKMKSAVSNYEYVASHGDPLAKNDSYKVFILLPAYTSNSSSLAPGNNESYAQILKDSKYRDTLYNSTNILIDELEIYQNISAYDAGGSGVKGGMSFPERYNLTYLNQSIDNVGYNITRDKIGMEHYNATYLEWYGYNLSFSLARTLLYSGQNKLAVGIYNASRDIMINSTRMYRESLKNWSDYRIQIINFTRGGNITKIINSTGKMRDREYGTLRNYLSDYLEVLHKYENSDIAKSTVMWWSRNVLNSAELMIHYYNYSIDLDTNTLPLLNSTIQDAFYNSNSYNNSTLLLNLSEEHMTSTVYKIAIFYGEYEIFNKVLDIFNNLKSILVGKESPKVKQYAWNMLRFNLTKDSSNGTGVKTEKFNVSPMLQALQSYRRWIYSKYSGNFTTMLWDYMSLEPVNLSYSNPYNITFHKNYTRMEMISDLNNITRDDYNNYLQRIKTFKNDSVETLIRNYTSSLNKTSRNITIIINDLNYLKEKYARLGGENATNLTYLLESMESNASVGLKKIGKTENEVYSLRMIEDFFGIRKMYENTLLSRDRLSALIIINFWNSSKEMKIYHIVKNYRSPLEFHTLSSDVLIKQIEVTATHDIETFLPLSLILLVSLLYITYRSWKNVILTLSAVLIALLWLVGFSAALGWDMDPITLAVPIMMIGIGVDDGIYVTLRYMEEREHRSRKRATIITVSSVGGALILTTLTSITGFLSNTISSMTDIQRFGFLAAAGLIFSFIAMNTYLPAMNHIIDSRGKRKDVTLRATQVGAKIALKNPYVIIVIAMIVSSAGIIAFQHISTEFSIRDLAPKNSDIVKYYNYYENHFNASVEISYIYFQGNLSSPQVLKAMAEVQENIANDKTVVHQYPVISPWSIMKMHGDARRGEYYYNSTFVKLFKESDTNGDGIPDKNITKLYSMLQPEISRVIRGNKAIFIIRTNSHDLKLVNLLVSELKDDAKPLQKYGKVEIAGDSIVGKASIDEINRNQFRSLTLSVIAAIVMLVILFFITKRSVTLGIIAALPIILVVTWNWLLMFFLGISLNIMTNTIASLCVGLGVDYGIHITHRFVEETRRYHDITTAILKATGNLGRGMLGASSTTIASIGILSLSSIPPLSNFALILSFSIFFSFVSSILVLPSLLLLWSRHRRKHGYDKVDISVKKALETGDYRTLCKYNVSKDYCLLYIKNLLDSGNVKEARKVAERLLEKRIDTRNLFRSTEELNPPFE